MFYLHLDVLKRLCLATLHVCTCKNVLQIIFITVFAFFCSWEKKKPLKFLTC